MSLLAGNLAYLENQNETKFSCKIGRRTALKKIEKYILDLLSVIYDFEEEEEAFLSSFFHALIFLFIVFPKRL